jgi:hypothetical protein
MNGSEIIKIERDRFQNYRVSNKHSESLMYLPSAELAIKASESLERFLAGGLQPAQWFTCICQLRKKSRKCECYKEQVPHGDHFRGFVNPKTDERIITHHPYYGWDWQNTIEAVTYDSEKCAAKYGLTVRVSEDSWYYPGKTLLVEYRIAKQAA